MSIFVDKGHDKDLFGNLEIICREYEAVLGGEDRLYWWTERAIVGATSTAAYKKGWPSIQEYHGGDKKKPARWVDLWIQIDEQEYIIEAKQIFYSSISVMRADWYLHGDFSKKILAAVKQLVGVRDDDAEWLVFLYLIPEYLHGEIVPENWAPLAEEMLRTKFTWDVLPKGCAITNFHSYSSLNDVVQIQEEPEDRVRPGFILCVITVDKEIAKANYKPSPARTVSE